MFGKKVDLAELLGAHADALGARDAEIAFLRERVKDLEQRITELAEPGISYRLKERQERKERPQTIRRAWPLPGAEMPLPTEDDVLVPGLGDERMPFKSVEPSE